MDLIERLINKDYLTERERKEWLGTIKERLEVLEQENKELKEIIEIRRQMNINLIDFGTKLEQKIEKLKKVIKIIKRMDIFFNQDEDFKDGSIEICGYLEVSEEVFELLKEVLGE